MGKKKNPPTNASPNSDAAEAAAQTLPANIFAAAPNLSLTLTDPSALENVRKRIAAAKAARGRTSLVIPLSTATGSGAGGISIAGH